MVFNVIRMLGAALAVLPLAALAQADTSAAAPANQRDQRIWSVQAGANALSHWNGTVDFGGPTAPVELDLKHGLQFGLTWGKQRGPMRYELEWQHGLFQIGRATLEPITADVDTHGSYDALTANVAREFAVARDWSLDAGLGVGIGRARLPHIGVVQDCSCIAEASRSGFAWQARVGVDYRVRENGVAFLQLGWLNLPAPRGATIQYDRQGFKTIGIGYRGQY